MILTLIRSYKNGYVWNDLSENDIIYPAEGAEYVLKGSELVEGCSGTTSTTHSVPFWFHMSLIITFLQLSKSPTHHVDYFLQRD